MARTIELAVWSEERRVAVLNHYAEVIGNARSVCKDNELCTKLNSARALGFELVNIFSGSPRAESPRLKRVVDDLDDYAAEFNAVSDKCQDTDPSLSWCLLSVSKESSNLAFYYHYPEKAGDDSSGESPFGPSQPMTDNSEKVLRVLAINKNKKLKQVQIDAQLRNNRTPLGEHSIRTALEILESNSFSRREGQGNIATDKGIAYFEKMMAAP